MFEGPQSGKFGIVHNIGIPITHMFNWTLDEISHTPETYYASNTLWAPNRNPGVIDWSGNFSLFDGRGIILPGQFLQCMELFTAPTTGVYGNVGPTYCGQGIVASNTLTWAWGPEQSLTQVVNFQANGCIAGRDRVIDDTTILTPSKMCGLQIHWAADDPPTDWILFENIQQAVLTLSATNPAFVNSSTGCCTHRRPGNINWTLALTLTDHRIITYTRNSLLSFRLYNSPTAFWELVYAIFAGTTNVNVNRQTGEIESQVVNFAMKAMSGNSMGHITKPDTTNYWPPIPTTNTTPGPPAKPTAAREAGTYNVDVTWTDPGTGDPATSYTVWASLDGIDFAAVGCTADSPYKDVGLPVPNADTIGSPYNVYYRVTGNNAQGQGPFSETSDALSITILP